MKKTYHQLSITEALQQAGVQQEGLNTTQVQERLARFGKNSIPQPKSKSLAVIFFSQFLNPLIYVLIAAAIISGATGDLKDTIFIAAIILINACLGAYQESRAENSAQALRNLVRVHSRVRRDGGVREVDSEDLVPGDIVLLESGAKVPADLRLLETNDLTIEEALLTGESEAVHKTTDALEGGEELPLGDRGNMAFAATTVQKGRGLGLVTATAAHTQIGKIADSLRVTAGEQPPLVRRMESFSKKISIIVLVFCVVLGVIGYFEGIPAIEIFFLMVAVGVSAIPEGLPVALTVALSIGTRRMAKRNVIVRKLPAVEGLGSCTMIASDKTGTLTMDQQSVKQLHMPSGKTYSVSGQGYNGEGQVLMDNQPINEPDEELSRFLLAAIFANEGILRRKGDGWEHSGDAVDVALRALTYKVGREPKYYLAKAKLEEMIPYESEKKYSAAYYREGEQLLFAMKGAVETVAPHLEPGIRGQVNAMSEKMATEGYRVLALAGTPATSTDHEQLPALQLYGLIGMIDPLRAEAVDAVKHCRDAGIEVVMVTGDHPATALAIARSLGIAKEAGDVISGSELSAIDQLPVQQLAEKISGKTVFARVAPLQKQKIVEAMKEMGHFVAVTGDGANDAPALKSAHIGVAMGSGTELAKEAASIIVADNNFASIEAGVEEGRFTYENLRKIIYLLISTGLAELLAVALAIFTNLPLPFIAVQLLWLNLMTNGIQDIALAFEKGDPSVMQRPPRRPGESIFDKQMTAQILVSGLFMAFLVFGVWSYLIKQPGFNERHGRTIIMMLMVLIQNFHVLNCRSETRSIFRVPFGDNPVLMLGIVAAQLIHISAAYIPGLNDILQLEPIKAREWLLLLPAAISVFLVMELFKWLWPRLSPKRWRS